MYTGISQSQRMDKIRSDIRGPIYLEALALEEQGEKVLKLNTGNPASFGFTMPDSVRQALVENVDKAVAYCDLRGMPAARRAILEYHTGKGIQGLTMDDIFVGNGVSELAEMAASTFLDPGDELLVPCPCYSLWSNSAHLCEARPVYYRLDEESLWYPDVADIERKITPRTKAIVIINPNNPTGAVYSRQVLLDILDVARRHNLLVCSDEIYDRLVMDDLVHDSCAALAPDVPVLTFNGLSKSHIICGFRCGWVTLSGPKGSLDQVRSGLVQLASLRLCGNALTQLVIPAALSDTESTRAMLVPGGRLYEQRRAAMEILQHSDAVSCVPNSAAFYVFPKIDARRFHIEDDREFALGLLRSKHILIVPGSGFDYPEPDHLRIVMLPRPDELKTAMQQLHEYLVSRE